MGWKARARRRALSYTFALAVAATMLSMAHDASALGPVTVEAAGVVGGATNPQDGAPNPLGFALTAHGQVGIRF